MEPVEINAGAYYLRQLRADDRVDDRPALMDAFADVGLRRWVTRWRISSFDEATEYVAKRAEEWTLGERCSWAVADPVSGELVGEVDLIRLAPDWRVAEAGCWVTPEWGGRGVAGTALGAALRFGAGALSVRRVDYLHAPDNQASYRVAQKCGFTHKGIRDGLVLHTLDLRPL
ncbi:MAG TPA: GNAT family N-acetyltransferase [Pseudonocardiaceae bacterium]|nr:GNAT family N-acetyltransferase [Pseudonocardiaceae bacterium]